MSTYLNYSDLENIYCGSQFSPLVGRALELEIIAERLQNPTSRLITILGNRGIGKTRLVLEAAYRQIGTFRDGVFFIPMSSMGTTDCFVSAIAEKIKLKSHGKDSLRTQLLAYLKTKHMLLCLDGIEHLRGDVTFLDDLLACAPHIILLVTARQPLALNTTECVIPIEGLDYPQQEEDTLLDDVSFEAVALFVQIAASVQPGFSLTPENRRDIFCICHHVEGVPLAIELAAQWVGSLSCSQIVGILRKIGYSTDILLEISPQFTLDASRITRL